MVDDPEQSPESGPSLGLTATGMRWLVGGALMLTALFGVGMAEATGVTQLRATIVRVVTGEGTLVVELDDPAVTLSIDGRGISILGAGPQSIRVLAGEHEVQATRNGTSVHVEQVIIERGGKQVVRIRRDTPTEAIVDKITDPLPLPAAAAPAFPVTLSEATWSRNIGPRTLFVVRYCSDAGEPEDGARYLWVIDYHSGESEFVLSSSDMRQEGKLRGELLGGLAPWMVSSGPYETWLEIQEPGRARRRISNIITVEPLWDGSRAVTATGPGGVPLAAPDPAPFPPKGDPNDAVFIELALADLESGDQFRRRGAAERLVASGPAEVHREKIVAAIKPLLDDNDLFTRAAGMKALLAWDPQESLDVILPLVKDPEHFVRWATLDALLELKDPRCVDVLAERLPKTDRFKIKPVLEAIGAEAEEAIIEFLTHDDWSLRLDVCRILETIGTPQSADALRLALRDENGLVRQAAEQALKAILEREGEP